MMQQAELQNRIIRNRPELEMASQSLRVPEAPAEEVLRTKLDPSKPAPPPTCSKSASEKMHHVTTMALQAKSEAA